VIRSRSKVIASGVVAVAAYVLSRCAAEVGSTERFLAIAILLTSIAVLQKSFDRLLVTILLLIGFSPMLGWVPGLSEVVDPVALIVATMLGLSCYSWERIGRRHACEVAIVGGSSLLTLWFWQMYWRVSPGREPLSLLLNGWDHVAHFNFFSMSTVHDSFLSRVPHPEGVTEWFTEWYPAGIQMFWSQLARVPENISGNTNDLLIIYGRVNVINAALILGLGLIAFMRVARVAKISLLIAFSLAIGAFVFVGPLSISLTAGYPNFGIACGTLFVGMSVILRPMQSVWHNAVILNGVVLVCAYNWFPVALPIALPVVAVLISDFFSASNGKKVLLFLISTVGLVGSALPILENLGLGTSHLEATGGIPLLLPFYPVAFALLSVLLSLHNFSIKNAKEVIRHFGVPVFNILVVLYVLVSNRLNSGTYPYYSQKFLYLGTAIAFFWTVLQLVELVDRSFEKSSPEVGNKRQATVFLLSGLAALQIWGYVGPDYSVFAGGNSATGLSNRAILASGRGYMNHSIAILEAIHRDQQFALGIERPVLIVDSVPSTAHPILLNYWPGVLNQRFSDAQFRAALKMGNVSMVPFFSFPEFIATFNAQFVPYEVDIVTTQEFARELLIVNPVWSESIYLYDGDDPSTTITKYVGTELVG
jgi:hypothetical protein